MRARWLTLILLTVIPVFSIVTMAQTEAATISGRVTDPSGAIVRDAEVIIINIDTNVSNSVTTNDRGIYVFPAVAPGRYRITVHSTGFKEIIETSLVVHVQDTISRNYSMAIGSASETVTVVADQATVNTESAAVGTVIDRHFVENLPLNGRSFNTLLQLTPGVVIAPTGGYSPGQFSIAGQRTDANNFSIDGVSANFGVQQPGNLGQSGTGGAQAFSALGGTSSLVSVDALQEFRIETSSFAPEFGRAPGGQIILTTRTGTNDFHGGLFDYFRNTVMDANDWFANHAGLPRAAEHHNDFGGFIGGPIWKDRTFFFVSYEGARLDQPQTQLIQVPSSYARSIAPSSLAPYLDAYPQPDDKAIVPGVYTSTFSGNYSSKADLDATSIRIDHTLNNHFSIFGRFNYAPSQTSGPNYSLSTDMTAPVDTETITGGLNMLFSAEIANTIRANFSTQSAGLSSNLTSVGGAVPLDTSLLLGSLPTSNNLAYFGTYDTQYLIVGSQGVSRSRQANVTDDLTVVRGVHQLKFGVDYRAIFLNVDNFAHEPQFLAPTVEQFLTTGTTSFSGATRLPVRLLTQAVSLYGQDTWRISPRLTLTYGLRWELNPAPSARGNTTLAAWTNVSDPATISLAPSGTPVWATSYDNVAPRLGIAYSLDQKGDLVLRAGGGIFYDLGVGSSASLASRFPNASFNYYPSVSLPIADLSSYLPAISSQPPYPEAVQGFSPGLKLPRSYQWNIALEKSFGGKQAISASYVGQAGRQLLRQQAIYQPNSNFAGDFILTVNDARSNYNSLQLQYRRPLLSRLQAVLNYTWSHSLDSASDDAVAALSNTIISASKDYASSNFDVRHSFSGALTYDLPGIPGPEPLHLLTSKWSLESVIVARSGMPFNGVLLLASPDPSGYALSRPDLVEGQPIWIGNSTAPGGRALNPNAFAIPSSPRQGTESRNDIPGFGLAQVDCSVSRRIPIKDKVNLQFRADAFNLFNHPNFANPLAYVEFGSFYLSSTQMLNQGLGGLNPLFQEGGPRTLQISLKLTF